MIRVDSWSWRLSEPERRVIPVRQSDPPACIPPACRQTGQDGGQVSAFRWPGGATNSQVSCGFGFINPSQVITKVTI